MGTASCPSYFTSHLVPAYGLGMQWRIAQVLGNRHLSRSPGSSSWLLAPDRFSSSHRGHLRSELMNGRYFSVKSAFQLKAHFFFFNDV